MTLVALFALTLGAYSTPVASPVLADEIIGYGSIEQDSGWLLIRHELYLTEDDGLTWQEVTPRLDAAVPLAADFIPGGHGWLVAGRPGAGDLSLLTLYRTSDFGRRWQSEPLSLFAADDPDPTIGGLALDLIWTDEGVLRVRHVSSSNFERWSEWRTVDGGETWRRTQSAAAASGDDAENRPDGASGGGVSDPNDGWQLERTGRCTEGGTARTCEQLTELHATSDGGRSWRKLNLPEGVGGSRRWSVGGVNRSSATIASESRTMVVGGQGFDKCEVATLDQLRDWRAASPYSAVNLYVGGALRACESLALSPSFLRAVYEMGWTFIPTWVGPQSPCTSYRSVISRDAATAWNQGWTEALAAVDTLSKLGLTEEDGSGSIVYYDMEYYNSTTDASCNSAVQAFAAGWKQGLHSRGNLAGVYSTGSILSLLTAPDLAPDAIWAANWIYSSFDPEATVFNVPRLGDDVWSNHQRLRQYTGGHDETWGSTTLRIDSNVLDGPVALMGPAPDTPTPTSTLTPTPTATPTATRTVVPLTPTAWFYLPLLLQD